jgi:hypothetical protein
MQVGSSRPDQKRFERLLDRYFREPVSGRTPGDREKILEALGIGNPREFLGMHIPLWEERVDELLDPASTDMLPVSLSHFYVNWVRGAIRTMPVDARVMIFTSKLQATGLKKAVLSLLRAKTGEAHRDFEVADVQLLQRIHKDTFFAVRTPGGGEHSFYLSHVGCEGEYIYSGLPGIVGLPAVPVAYHVTPQGEEVLVKPTEEGVNICLDERITTARILRAGAWGVEGAARQDALGDCVGTALRFGHYYAVPGKKVVMVDNIELFHLDDADVRLFEPVHEFLPRRAYPGNAAKSERLHRKMREDYRKAYDAQMETIRGKWPEIERYLVGMHRLIRRYTGEPFEAVMARVKARVFGKARGE